MVASHFSVDGCHDTPRKFESTPQPSPGSAKWQLATEASVESNDVRFEFGERLPPGDALERVDGLSNRRASNSLALSDAARFLRLRPEDDGGADSSSSGPWAYLVGGKGHTRSYE